MATIGPGLVLLAVLAIAILYYFTKRLKPLIINSIVGLIILFVVNTLNIVSVAYSIPAILIIAFGGVPGAVLVVILAHLNIAFMA